MRCWGKQRQLRTYVLLGTPCCRCFAPAPIFIWVLKICLIVFWYLWTVRGEETTFFLKIFQGILMWQAVISQGKKPNGWRHVFRDLIKDLFFFPATPTPFSTNGPLERCEPSTCSKGELDGCCPRNGWLGFCGMLGWMVSNNPNKRSFGLFKLRATDKTRYCRSRFCDDLRMQVNR